MTDVADALADVGDIPNSQRVLGLVPQHISAIEMPIHSNLRSNAQAHMAKGYVRTGQIQTARKLVSTTDNENPLASFDVAMVLKEIAKKQVLEGNLNAAIETISDIGNDGSRVLDDICIELVKIGRANDSLQIVNTIKDVERRNRIIIDIAEEQTETGDLQGAADTIGSIQDVECKALGWVRIVDTHLKNTTAAFPIKLLETALFDVRRSSKARIRTMGLSGIAVAVFEGGDIEKAKVFLREARQIAEMEEEPSVHPIAMGYAMIGETGEAVKLAEDAKSQERSYIFVSIAIGICRTGKLEEAIKIIEIIDDTAAKAAALKMVAETILEQENRNLNARQLLRKVSLLLKSIKGMLDDRPVRDRDPKLAALRIVVITQAKLGDWNGALETVNIIQRDYKRAPWQVAERALHDITHAQAEAGLASEALKLVKKYKDPLAKTYILLGIAKGMLEKKKVPGLETGTQLVF